MIYIVKIIEYIESKYISTLILFHIVILIGIPLVHIEKMLHSQMIVQAKKLPLLTVIPILTIKLKRT